MFFNVDGAAKEHVVGDPQVVGELNQHAGVHRIRMGARWVMGATFTIAPLSSSRDP
jgi:hypothetical protein